MRNVMDLDITILLFAKRNILQPKTKINTIRKKHYIKIHDKLHIIIYTKKWFQKLSFSK